MSVVWVCLIQVSTGRSIFDAKDDISHDLKQWGEYLEGSASSMAQQYRFPNKRAGIIVFNEDSSEDDFGANSSNNNPLPLALPGAPSFSAQHIFQQQPSEPPSHPAEAVHNKPSLAEILSPDHETTTPTRVERSVLRRLFESFKLLLP